ncbi:MAG: glycosyltransferase family 2 protein [Chitinispirillaceae bacterium]|nr:glycosyltransferase family 2 protein [Chitinispirillaceae bacterium]
MCSNPLVSIVVLNWNGATIFPPCLESLARLEYRPYEVLFVDNGSTDGSVPLARTFPKVSIVENKQNLGYAAGNNQALLHIHRNSAFVCFLNNDVVVTPSWLNEVVRYLQDIPSVGVVASRNMNYYNREIIDGLYHCIVQYFSLARFGWGLPCREDPLFNKPGYVLSALGASAVYRTALVRSLGGFDESFFAYWEDADLCMRINNSGFRCLYVPSAVVYHMDQASFKKDSSFSYYLGERNRLFFIRKNFPLSFIVARLGDILREDLRSIKCCLHKDRDLKVFLKARRDSIVRIGNYRYAGSKGSFDSSYIQKIITSKKLPL